MLTYDETQTTADELIGTGVWNTLSFGPALLDDGQIVDGIETVEVDQYIGKRSIQGSQPRTGIGLIEPGHFVFIVVDGRSPGYSRGMTMTEFAQLFANLGCGVAYNLDGGGSATMYFNGAIVNNPLGRGLRPCCVARSAVRHGAGPAPRQGHRRSDVSRLGIAGTRERAKGLEPPTS